MEQKSSNKASVIVAIIAVLLILGGVFLLNQSFNRSSDDNSNDSSSTSESSFSISSRSSLSVSSRSSSSLANLINPADDPTETPGSSSSSSTVSQSSSSSLSVSSRSSSSSSSSSASDLQKGEIVAEVTEANGNSYTLSIKESTFEDSTFFRSGRATSMTLNGTTLEQGKTYKIRIDFTETESGFSINLIEIVSEV